MSDDTSSTIVDAPLDVKGAVTVLPPVQLFEIDDDNFIFNGEAFFHLSDVKSVIKTVNQNQPTVGVILFNFLGSQLGIPVADLPQRDEIYEEVKNRLRAIKNGTIKTYIANQNRKRQAA
jgi:hypothetical protein